VRNQAMSLSGIQQSELIDEYDRRRLEELSDTALVGAAASLLGLPLASDEPAGSFVLHAPLELLARAWLLAYVAPAWRPAARLRIVSLVCGYERAGQAMDLPGRPLAVEPTEALVRLGSAIATGDLEEVDALAAFLGGCCSAGEVSGALAHQALTHLGAAGHANIYLDLSKSGPVGAAGPRLVWPMARELAKSPGRAMCIPAPSTPSDQMSTEGISEGLSHLELVGPAGATGIAAMVEHAEAQGVPASLLDRTAPALWAQPYPSGMELLRCAALIMLQGPPEHAPYGWTHCLTLPHSALAQAGEVSDPRRPTAVAATYVAAHWSTLADRCFNPAWVPEPVSLEFAEALEAGPAMAASAVWHAPDEELTGMEQDLATRAAVSHDAHHVKYSLACLRAAASDRPARRLYLAAASYLCAWWIAHPDGADPLPGLSTGPGSATRAPAARAVETARS
jgi:hypothetical protein